MTQHSSPIADELRSRGFIKLPPLWIKPEDMPAIHAIAHKYASEVTAVRRQVQLERFRNQPVETEDDEDLWSNQD